jgi:GAF domain-containing protein
VLDEEHQVLRCRVSVSMSREEMDGLVIPIGEGISGRIAVGRMPRAIADIRDHPHNWRADLAAKHGHVAYLGLPVILGDQLLGVLAFSNAEPKHYTDAEVESLTVFARQAAIAIRNGRLHEAAVHRGSQLEALVAAARSVTSGLDLKSILDRILAEAARISGAPHVKVLLLDRAAGVLRVGALQGSAMPPDFALPVGVGSSGLVAQTGQPVYMADAQHDPRSIFAERDRELGIVTYLGLPIKRGDEVLGVLTFNTTVPRQYNPEELAYVMPQSRAGG